MDGDDDASRNVTTVTTTAGMRRGDLADDIRNVTMGFLQRQLERYLRAMMMATAGTRRRDGDDDGWIATSDDESPDATSSVQDKVLLSSKALDAGSSV